MLVPKGRRSHEIKCRDSGGITGEPLLNVAGSSGFGANGDVIMN
jgi:hypothetical protein